MAADPFGVVRVHDGLGCGTDSNVLFELSVTAGDDM